MDITLNEQQALIAETALAFAREALSPDRIRALEDDENGFDPTIWRRMVELGWAGAVFPARYGGSELGLFELALIVEALGRGAVPSPLFSCVVEAGLLLLDAGTPAQRSDWLPRIADGRTLLTTAIPEPHGALDPGAIRTQLIRSPRGWRVQGTKLFVRDAGAAEAILCLVRDGEGAEALSFVLVPSRAQGVARRRLRASGGESLWEVVFDDVYVGEDALVGPPGGAWPFVERLLARGAVLKAAELAGIGQAALDLTVEYAKTRVQFGKPIGTFQTVQRHCAEMYRDITLSRLLAWQAAARLAAGLPALRESGMAKAKASEVIPRVTRTAHQVHGAFGFYRAYPLELYYHRAIAAAATYGDAMHHRRRLARLLREDIDVFRGDHCHTLPDPL